MALSPQMDRRLFPSASRVQMSAATLGVYRVGRPRPRRAPGFGLAFRLSVRVVLDVAVMAGNNTRFMRFSASPPEGSYGAARGAHSAIMALAVPLGVGVWLPTAVAAFPGRNRRIGRLGHGLINWRCEWRCPLYPRKQTSRWVPLYVCF